MPLFLIAVLLGGAVGGIYLFRPQLFERGVQKVKHILGEGDAPDSKPPAAGPEFDAPAAGEILSQAAGLAPKCKEPGGPLGKGRAQVLYETSGSASSVAVSKPFHETTVGRCLIDMFMKTKVPSFGGDPVIVEKTFDVQ